MSELDLVEDYIRFYKQLSDSGLTWGDYAEQLTFLIFLKMDYEYTQEPYNKKSKIQSDYNWDSLLGKSGTKLEKHYQKTLDYLGKQKGLTGKIFRKSQNDFKKPAILEQLIKKINKKNWLGLDVKDKGRLYDTILEKHAQTMKTDSAEFPTPRVLARAIINVLKPKPSQIIHDPACGTGGFFIIFHNYIIKNFKLDREQKIKLKKEIFTGTDISDGQVRFCLMNLIMHGITEEEKIIESADSLTKENPDKFRFVLVDPPFGKKATTGTQEKETYERQDFWVTTSDKHLNFLQHAKSLLKINGQAAVLVPDNILFASNGETVRKNLMKYCDLHTILRLPTGILHKPNSKTNILFFDRKPARTDEKPWTSKIWFYDLRTDNHFTPKKNPIQDSDFDDFIKCFKSDNILNRRKSKRFRAFSYNKIKKSENTSLDVQPWIEDEEIEKLRNLPPPKEIANKIIVDLQSATTSMKKLVSEL